MSWKKVKLGDILKRRRETIKINPDEDYKLVTIRIHHKGVTQRCIMRGSEIKSPMSAVKAGDFILSGIDARNGAFGIVPDELDGAIVTNDFWCLDPDDTKIEKEFLLFLTSTDFFDFICKQSSDGMTQRIRLQKDKFYNYEIALPSKEEQKTILKKLKEQKANSEILNTELTHQLDLVKKLRQQFLQEAVQGKLIRNEELEMRNTEGVGETGAALLERIKAEKAKTGKKEKPLPPIKDDEIPFDIPDNWVWCRLGDICSKIGSGSTPNGSNYSNEGFPFFRSQNIYNEGLIYDDIKYISSEVHQQMNGTVVLANDILLNITGGSMGRCASVPSDFEEGNVSQHVCIIRPIGVINSFYHKIVLSPFFQKYIFSSTTGAGREGLPKYNLEQFVIPLPPLSIQAQIVAKVEELMGLCDALEAGIRASKGVNEALLQQVLREALAG